MTEATKVAPRYPDDLPREEVQRGLLATAIGRDLDRLAEALGHQPRGYGESDQHLRARLGGS